MMYSANEIFNKVDRIQSALNINEEKVIQVFSLSLSLCLCSWAIKVQCSALIYHLERRKLFSFVNLNFRTSVKLGFQ